MATENIMMECVKAGGDRQELHERIRELSQEAGANVKVNGGENDLLDRIRKDPMFAAAHDKLEAILEPKNFVGRAPHQTEEFIKNEIDPILDRHRAILGATGEVRV